MEFYIADRLGMTVERMRREMSNSEYVLWSLYHQRKAQKQQQEQNKAKGRQLSQQSSGLAGGARTRGR